MTIIKTKKKNTSLVLPFIPSAPNNFKLPVKLVEILKLIAMEQK